MVPFMNFELKSIIKSLMELIVKPLILEKCKNPTSFKTLDLSKEENLLLNNEIELGFAMKDLLNKLKVKDIVPQHEIAEFKREACCVIRAILDKLFERSPIMSNFLRFSNVLGPSIMVVQTKKSTYKTI